MSEPQANAGVKVFADTYLDSVLQLSGTRTMFEVDGVEWAAAAMATPANMETLLGQGFDQADVGSASANDLFIAVRAADAAVVDAALEAGEHALFAARDGGGTADRKERKARTIEEAVRLQPGTNVAVVSVPGDYAALEAHKALSAGLHVLLFSDNVSVDDEIALKDRAGEVGRLLMGPGAGTAMLGGTGLGFANVVKRGRVGVIAAAGTGAQEAMTLLDRWGVGVSHVIGLGGRDLSEAVDGRMARLAIAALRDDPGTDAILLVSKPPSERVARDIVGLAGGTPLIASLVGLDAPLDLPERVEVLTTLEEGVVRALAAVGVTAPDPSEGLAAEVEKACAALGDGRRLVRGLFSGGTLCYESLVIMSRLLGPVWSNTPLDKRHRVPAPAGSHVCLDLGEEEYTKGRPHPMIDPEARVELMREEGRLAETAVVLIDVVLGHSSHPDPAGALAPVCADIIAGGAGPRVVAYVLGTDGDPQGFEGQRATLRDAGCIVTETAARASLAAAAIALREPARASGRP
jgi:FdrA protein